MNKIASLALAVALALNVAVSTARAQNQTMYVDTSSTIYEYNNGVKSTFASGFSSLGFMAFDSSGDLFVDTNNGVANAGKIYEFVNTAGNLSSTPSIIVTGLSGPTGMAFDSAGNLYVSNDNGLILKYTNSSGTYSTTPITFIGTFSKPEGLAFNSSGVLFIADFNEGAVIEALPPNAGSGGASTGALTFANSNLLNAAALTFDTAGNLYVTIASTSPNGAIYEYSPSGTRTTVATGLSYPVGLAFDSSGDLFATSALGKLYEFTNNAGTLSSTPITTTVSSGAADVVFSPVPEPSTWMLTVAGVVVLTVWRRPRGQYLTLQ